MQNQISNTSKQKTQYSEALKNALAKKRDTGQKRVLRLKDITKRVGISKTAIYQLIKQGDFPQSFSLGGRMVAWLETDIEAFIESRLAQSIQG